MKGIKIIMFSTMIMLFLAIVPLSQAHHAEQAVVETEPTLNSDLYMGFGILVILLVILALGFMSYQKEGQVPPQKTPVKRKKKPAKKAIVEEEPVKEKPVKKTVKKKAEMKVAKGSKTYTSNNVEIVELTRRKKHKVKRKIKHKK